MFERVDQYKISGTQNPLLQFIRTLLFRHSIFYYSDLCSAFGVQMVSLLDVDPISELLTCGRRSKASKTKNLSQWATKEIRKLKNMSSQQQNSAVAW